MSDEVKRLEKHVPLKATQVQQGLYGAKSKLPDALEKAAMARGKSTAFSGASDVTYPLPEAELSDMAKKRIKEGIERISDVADEYQRESTRGIKKMKSGGKVSSASKRADGIAVKGKTRGKMV